MLVTILALFAHHSHHYYYLHLLFLVSVSFAALPGEGVQTKLIANAFLTHSPFANLLLLQAFQTPLMIAINKKFTDLALKFIEMGADLEAEDVSGKTPLWYSIVNKTDDVTIVIPFSEAPLWPSLRSPAISCDIYLHPLPSE